MKLSIVNSRNQPITEIDVSGETTYDEFRRLFQKKSSFLDFFYFNLLYCYCYFNY